MAEPLRLLLADDEPLALRRLRLALNAIPDVQVVGAANDGAQAIIAMRDLRPDVVLLDEPASALDPISTQAIEDLMHELKKDYTLVIVTHNMQQAARVAEMTAFFSLQVEEEGRHGVLVEYDSTEKIFTSPADERTEGYVTGRFG